MEMKMMTRQNEKGYNFIISETNVKENLIMFRFKDSATKSCSLFSSYFMKKLTRNCIKSDYFDIKTTYMKSLKVHCRKQHISKV